MSCHAKGVEMGVLSNSMICEGLMKGVVERATP